MSDVCSTCHWCLLSWDQEPCNICYHWSRWQSDLHPDCGADMRIAKQIIHDAIDNTPMAEDIFVGIKEKLHKAVDAVDELSRENHEKIH